MAATTLSDVIVPEVYDFEVALRMIEKSAVFQSGIVQANSLLSSFASSNMGQLIHIPAFNALTVDESDISSDDSADVITPLSSGSSDQRALKNMRAQAWASMDLVAALASADPMAVIAAQVGDYWAHQFDRHAIAILDGIIADNIANDAIGQTTVTVLIFRAFYFKKRQGFGRVINIPGPLYHCGILGL